VESDTIGKRIREVREERGLTLREVSARAGLTVNGISRVELGRTMPTAATIAKLAQGLGVEPGVLFPKAQSPSSSALDDVASEKRRHLDLLLTHCEHLVIMYGRFERLASSVDEGNVDHLLALADALEANYQSIKTDYDSYGSDEKIERLLREDVNPARQKAQATYEQLLLLGKVPAKGALEEVSETSGLPGEQEDINTEAGA
jgi:transcriptional regulator with XRE-family HTH domain